jgi:hypothetical protein
MAAHVLRLHRLTLKAGRKAGCRAGGPIVTKTKIQIRKICKFKNRKSQKSNLKKLSSQFFALDRSRNGFQQDSCSQDRRQDFRFGVSSPSIGNVQGVY